MAQQDLKKSCTAEYFATTWRKYDADGNGYIEGGELLNFLKDLAEKANEKLDDESKINIAKYTTTFMATYDKNKDGRIDMKELAELLNPEENFLFLIRTESGPSSVEYMQIWKKYDADASGYIDSSELKSFLKDAYGSCGKPLSEAKLKEYTTAALHLYDRDGNHKLSLDEMMKLLPLATNYLKDIQFDQLSAGQFHDIFAHYDKNHDDSIEGSELDNLLRDLLRKESKTASPDAIASLKQTVMQHCDTNKDGKIQFQELSLVLNFKD